MSNKSNKLEKRSGKFLDKIIEFKRSEFFQKTQKVRVSDFQIIRKSETQSFLKLFDNRHNKKLRIIAEIKFASPTNPHLGSHEELVQRAKTYKRFGADAISIITEKKFFKGDLNFISQVKKYISLPVLQKDFVIDEAQIFEAKEIKSDALLLIARLVSKKTLKEFVALCNFLGIEPIVEVNNQEDLEKAIATKTKIIAVNARDLETFAVDVASACVLIEKIPSKFLILGFSGITSKEEVSLYKDAGVSGILVGTSLMKTKNIGSFLRKLDV